MLRIRKVVLFLFELTHNMAMLQPLFTSTKWNMGGNWAKTDGEMWSRKNTFEISSCGSHFLLINFTS